MQSSFSCSGINPDVGTAQTLVGAVDCFVEQAVAQSYGALTNPGSSFGIILTSALTIYIALLGFQLMLGRTQLRLGDLVPKFMLIGAVLAITASWGTWQTLVYDVLSDGPEEVARMISGGNANSRSVTQRVDYVSGLATDIATVWSRGNGAQSATAPNATPAPQSPTDLAGSNQPSEAQRATASVVPNVTGGPSPGPNLLIWSALLFTLASAGVLAIAKAMLALVLALGPLFLILALFRFTRDLMLGWARAALFLAIIPLLSLLTTLAGLELIQPMAEGMGIAANQGVFSLKSAVAMFVAVLVIIGVSILVFRVAGIMTAHWTMRLSPSSSTPDTVSVQSSPYAPAGMPQSQAITNPRVEVLLNALERNAAQTQNAAPNQAEGGIRREIVTGANIQQPQTISVRTSDIMANQNTSASAQRRISSGRSLQARSPLRPVRGAA